MNTDTTPHTFTREFSSEDIANLCAILAPLAEGRKIQKSNEEIALLARAALDAVTGWPKN